ncbi:MAG: hypothetical protein QOD93_671 [Acetobacteraceae bacterium]|nr:hypothetical protein [Acetobacteraceae bacterium]
MKRGAEGEMQPSRSSCTNAIIMALSFLLGRFIWSEEMSGIDRPSEG